MLSFFFFNDTATTEIYTLSLHDALPISGGPPEQLTTEQFDEFAADLSPDGRFVAYHTFRTGSRDIEVKPLDGDRKSTRLNSSHVSISYAVFCLKKKKKQNTNKKHI